LKSIVLMRTESEQELTVRFVFSNIVFLHLQVLETTCISCRKKRLEQCFGTRKVLTVRESSAVQVTALKS